MLVANKIDLRGSGGVTQEEVNRYLQRHKKWQYIECSAKQNVNVRNIFKLVGSMVREQEREKEKLQQQAKVKIHHSKLRKNADGGGCC